MRTIFKLPRFFVVFFSLFLMSNSFILYGEAKKNNHAIVIAIDDYHNEIWSPLSRMKAGANAIRSTLEEKYNFSEVTTIYNESATRINILSIIENKVKELNEEDNLMIYFSGHTTKVGMETYWVPCNAINTGIAGLVPTTEIKNIVSGAKSKHILLMVDGLFRNDLMKSINVFKINDGSTTFYTEMNELLSRQILISGSEKPVKNEADKYTVFTEYFLRYLNKNEKDVFSADELFLYLKNSISANTLNMPEFGHIQNTGHEGGQFLFRLDKKKGLKLCDSPVYFEEGEIVKFDEKGGVLHAKTDFKNVKYEWSFNSEILDHEGANLEVKKPGMYGVTVIMEDGDCSNSAIAEVDVILPNITIDILEGYKVLFTHEGTLNAIFSGYNEEVIYEWRKENFIFGNTKSIKVTESNNYTVLIKLPDGRELGRQTAQVIIKHREYTVQLGDDIKRIARKFYNDESKAALIYEANPELKEGEILRVGISILIPRDKELSQKVTSFSIGASETFAPFTYSQSYNGGMLTDIVQTVYDEMEQSIDLKYLKGNRIKGVYGGLTDLGFPFTKNKNDELLFLYSAPIYTTLVVFFANSDSKITDIKETVKHRIRNENYTKIAVGIPANFICDALLKYAKEEYILLRPYSTSEACFEAMKSNEIDLVAIPQIVGLVTIQNTPELDRKKFKILEKSVESTTLHLVVSKEHPEALTIINNFDEALERVKSSGRINQIIDTHIDIIQNKRP